jgi:poly-gamma-glutamate capsule biosynthesis protein CapA/YwtB (metallophosphatase superfamily)
MLYESGSGDMTMALTGEALITRALSPFREEDFLRIVTMLREADVTFTNAEMLFHDYEGSPGIEHGGTYMRAEPRLIAELQWAGIDIAAAAMNHCYDYGETGVLVNLEHFKEHELPCAGTGENLALATSPAYLDTAKGRVALIAACDHLQVPGGKAVDQRPDMKGKPGVNFIDADVVYTVDRAAFAELQRIGAALGIETAKQGRRSGRHPQHRELDTDTLYHFTPRTFWGSPVKFQLGTAFGMSTTCNPEDLARNLKWVRDARRMADWVLFSFHCGYPGATPDEPAPHLVELAHAVIDAGADVFIGHGLHRDKGIEIHQGKPIFYSLGNFILQNDTVLRQPADAYARYQLGLEATPADFYDARSGKQTRGQDVNPINWQSAVATVTWEAKRLREIRLHPIDLGMGLPMGQRGRPVTATGRVARDVLERFQRMSKPFGVAVALADGVGVIKAG